MSMMNAISSAYGENLNAGALSPVMDRNRSQKIADKAEAIAKGRSGSSEDVDKKLRGVAEEFVSVFMNQVMKSMRATVPENSAMHGDNGEKFFQELLDTEQSKSLAKGSGYGLTDLVYQALSSQARVSSSSGDTESTETAVSEAVEGKANL